VTAHVLKTVMTIVFVRRCGMQ